MSTESGLQSQPPRENELAVRSLLIPIDGMALLVPNALVSEVASLGEIETAEGPEGMLGMIEWRGLRIPLLSFERIVGGADAVPNRNSRAIVFNTLNGNRELPFVAVLSQRIPRLLLVTGRMLSRTEDGTAQDGVLDRIEMHGDEVFVPDMDFLERMLTRNGVKVKRVTG